MDDEIYELVRESFQTYDGSLPAVELTNLTPTELAAIYSFIRQRCRISGDPTVWDNRRQQDVKLESVANLAELVATGEAAPVIFYFTGLKVADVELPELGLFVFADAVELSLRAGPEWARPVVHAFFQLLTQLRDLTSAAKVEMPEMDPLMDKDSFARAWSAFQRNDG